MNQLKRPLKILGEIYDCLQRAYKSGTRRAGLFARIDALIDELEELIAKPDTSNAINDALVNISSAIHQFALEPVVRQYVESPKAEFIKFEMKLCDILGTNKRQLTLILGEVSKNLKQGRITPAMLNDNVIPGTADKLVYLKKMQVAKAKNDLADAINKPRVQKKKSKSNSLERFALGIFGAGIAVGNVLLALPTIGLGAAVAIASMTTGALSLGASVFDAPELLKELKRINSCKASKSDEG